MMMMELNDQPAKKAKTPIDPNKRAQARKKIEM